MSNHVTWNQGLVPWSVLFDGSLTLFQETYFAQGSQALGNGVCICLRKCTRNSDLFGAENAMEWEGQMSQFEPAENNLAL